MAEQPEDWGAVPATPQAPSQTPDEWGAIPASSYAKPTQITRDEWGGVPADMVDDEKFDPAAHAAQHPEDADAAYAIYSARKNQGLGQWAKGIGKAAINRKTYVNMGKGLMNLAGGVFQVPADIAAHSYYSATGNPAALTKQAEATIEGQRGEGTFKNLAETIGSVVDAADPSTWLYQSPKMKEDAQRLLFNQRVQQATHEMKLANGIPLDTGAIAGIYGARNALGKSVYGSNFPAETPSQEVGPEALKSAGAPPVDQGNIERASAIGDPTMLALAAAPALLGAGYLGGRIAQGAGKLAQIPMGLAERGAGALSHLGPAGRIAAAATGGAGIVPAAMAAAHNPMLAAVVGGSALGLKGLQLLGRAAESQGKELATGIPSAATTEAANAAATGGRAIGANVKRAAGNAITQGASTAVGMTPLNLALSDGDPNQFVQSEVGAGGFGAALGAFARNRPQMVESIRPFLRQEGTRALTEAGQRNDPLAIKSQAYIGSLPEEAQHRVLETIGALQGLPTISIDGTKRAKLYVLNGEDFQQAFRDMEARRGEYLQSHGFDALPSNFPSDGAAGFFNNQDGSAVVNGDARANVSPDGLSHTVGHEFGGHAALNIMHAMGAKGGALFDGLMKSVKDSIAPNGKISPQLYRFAAEYNRGFDPDGQTKHLDLSTEEGRQTALEEWISEQVGQIIASKGAGEIALPRNLQDKINDGIGRFMGGLLGMDTRKIGTETHFGREEVGAITKAVQDTLEQVVGMKLREGQEIPEAPKTDTTRIVELNQILSTPRPPAGTPVTQVHQWIRDQRAARTELNQLQEGLQPSFPAAGARPTPPSAPTAPTTPTNPSVGNRASVAAALRLNGIPAAEAAQWAQQAVGATTEEMVLDALRKRAGQKFPSQKPVAPTPEQSQTPANQTEVFPTAENAPTPDEQPQPTPAPNENGTLPPGRAGVQEQAGQGVASPESLSIHQTPEEFAQIAAQAREQFLSDKEAAKSGKNKGQHTTANLKAAEKAAFDAAAAAHAQTVPENYQGLRQRTDTFGKTSVSGKVDPSRPFDAWLIKQAKESGNLNDESLKTLLSLQDAIGHTVSYDYGHAPTIDEGDMPTKAGRAGQQAEHTVAKRLSGESPMQTERKTSVPLRVGFNPGSKSFTVYGVSQEKLLNNFNHLTEKMDDLGIAAPFRDINDPRFVSAFKAVIANHEHGWTGDGKSPSVGTEEFPNRPDREWATAPEHQIVPGDQFQFINALLADEGAKPPTRGDATVSKAKAHLANENRRLLNAEGETNSLRQQINEAEPGWTKKTLEDPLNENISPALASNLGPASQSDESIRQHGKVGDLSRFFPEGRTPNRAKTSAGFLPDTGRPSAVLSKQDERAGYKLFNVDPAKLEAGWKKDPMYVGPDFEGGIKGRKGGIQDWLQKNPAKPMEAASVTVDPDGTVSFSNGRHRTRLLMEQGASAIPLAIDPDSIQNARANGLIPSPKEEAMQRIAARTKGAKSGSFMPEETPRIHPAALRLASRYGDYYSDESVGAGEKIKIPIEDINFDGQKLDEVSPLSDNRDKPIIVREKDDGYDILDGFGRASGLRNAGREYAHAILVTKGDITDLANGRAGGDDADWNHAVYEKYGLNPQKLSQGNFMPDSKPSREEPAPEGQAPSGSPPNPLSSGGTSRSLAQARIRDREYSSAVASGDMEEAQRHVDEAAKEAGYNGRGFHGSPVAGLKEFSPESLGENTGAKSATMGFFHTSNPEVAQSYDSQDAQKISHLTPEEIPSLLKSLRADLEDLKAADPMDYAQNHVSSKTENEVGTGDMFTEQAIPAIEERISQLENANFGEVYDNYLRYKNPMEIDAGGKQANQIRLSEQVEEAKKEGHDAVIVKNVRDAMHFGTHSSTVTVVFDPSQIKSADAITRDDSGNAIPPSQRFNTGKTDMRFMPDTGKPEDGETPGERLMREAEAAGLLPSIDVIKGVLKGDSAAYEKLRAMIRDRTGKPARFMPKEAARQRILERQKAA